MTSSKTAPKQNPTGSNKVPVKKPTAKKATAKKARNKNPRMTRATVTKVVLVILLLSLTLVPLLITLAGAAGATGTASTAGASGASTRAAEQASPSPLTPALQRLAACVSGQKQLAVVMLVDESGSLRKTDPGNGRVIAAQAAVNGLADLVRRSNDQVRIDLQVAGFGVDFERDAPWGTLNAGSLAATQERVASFADRNRGIDTDYVNALQGAQLSLQNQAKQMTPENEEPPCTAVLWFTDGKFDVEDRLTPKSKEVGRDANGNSQFKDYAPDVDLYLNGGGQALVERGKQTLCVGGGVADQYRSSQTSLFGVALTTQIDPADQEFLRSVVAGGGCGDQDGTQNGDLLAGDLGQLVSFFDQVVTGLGNPSSSETVDLTTCPSTTEQCAQGTKTFDVDGALRRFHVLAQVDTPGVAVRLTAPGAAPVDIPVSGNAGTSGALQAGETAITWAWLSANALTIDAESSPSGNNWAGTWTVTFIDTTGKNPGAPVRAQIYLFGDVVPQLKEAPKFRAGEENKFVAVLTRSEGTPIPVAGLTGTTTMTATVTDPSSKKTVDLGPLTKQPDGTWQGVYRAENEVSAASVNISLTANVTTASGVALPPSSATSPVVVLPPIGFPIIITRTLSVGPISGTKAQSAGVAKIKVEGSPNTATCVWLDQLKLDPGSLAAGKLSVAAVNGGASEKNCLKIKKGGAEELELRFTSSESLRGLATGQLQLGTRSLEANKNRPATVSLNVQLVKPANAGVAGALFAILMLIGVGLPILAFYVTNFIVGKFAPRSLMMGGSVKVKLTETVVERLEPAVGGALLLPEDFTALGGDSKPSKSFDYSGVHFRAAVSKNPFSPPFGKASVAGQAAIGSDRSSGGTAGTAARIPLWISKEWLFIPDPVSSQNAASSADEFGDLDGAKPADTAVTGRLIAFVPALGMFAAIAALQDTLRDRLPSRYEQAKKVRLVTPRVTKVKESVGPGGKPISETPDSKVDIWNQPLPGKQSAQTPPSQTWKAPTPTAPTAAPPTPAPPTAPTSDTPPAAAPQPPKKSIWDD